MKPGQVVDIYSGPSPNSTEVASYRVRIRVLADGVNCEVLEAERRQVCSTLLKFSDDPWQPMQTLYEYGESETVTARPTKV